MPRACENSLKCCSLPEPELWVVGERVRDEQAAVGVQPEGDLLADPLLDEAVQVAQALVADAAAATEQLEW